MHLEPLLIFVSTIEFSFRNDVCECGEGEECLCEVLADYSRACAAHGIYINWRNASTCGKLALN